jgi:surface protein
MMNGDITEHSDKTTTVGMWKDDRLKIKNITFSNDLSNLPSSCTEANLCWDITDSESIYPVYHYLVQNETDTTKYDAYIVSEEKIYAPKDSSGIFALCGEESGSYVSYVENINFNNNFDTSKVTNMYSMFFCLPNLKGVDVSNFNTVNVTNMSQLFCGCKSLTEVDVSSFDTSKVTNMRAMFGGTSASGDMHLKEIKVSDKFVTDNVTDMLEMFRLCRYLNFTFNVTGNKVTNYTNIFNNTATDSNAKIVVNYTAETETLVDNMLATVSSGRNVVKGKQI